MHYAFEYIAQYSDLAPEILYPYTGEDGVCNHYVDTRHGVTISGHIYDWDLDHGLDVELMRNAL